MHFGIFLAENGVFLPLATENNPNRGPVDSVTGKTNIFRTPEDSQDTIRQVFYTFC